MVDSEFKIGVSFILPCICSLFSYLQWSESFPVVVCRAIIAKPRCNCAGAIRDMVLQRLKLWIAWQFPHHNFEFRLLPTQRERCIDARTLT
jgi:hypothetical protein